MVEKVPEPKPVTQQERGEDTVAVDTTTDGADTLSARTRGTPNNKNKTPESSYGNYLFAGAGSNETPAWSDTAKGRFAIRMVSRGLVGATFFAVGGRIANRQLKGYSQSADWNWDKPLQIIAKGIDTTLGRGIQGAVTRLAKLKYSAAEAEAIGKRAVTFRESRPFEYVRDGLVHKEMGRSYGADIVGFTFDFAMASIGDAGTRAIIQGFDPNIKKTWLVNDAGDPAKRGERKHFLPGEWLKAVGKSTWRVFSKNQGEDWAAAIPYAFQMKFQRQFLSNAFGGRWNGHQLVFDHSWNGGAYRVNQQGRIVGDYQLVGALDLHARFVGYNWYTLMFREGYDAAGRAWNRWKDNGYKISIPVPEHFNPITTPIDGALHAARYVTKSFIKANMYMNPAVCFFWPFRVAQSKWRGRQFVEEGPGGKLHLGPEAHMDIKKPFEADVYARYVEPKTGFDRFEQGFSKLVRPLGKASHIAGEKAANAGVYLNRKGYLPKGEGFRDFVQDGAASTLAGGRRLAHEIVDASFSYTPYMYAKQEIGLRVDDTKGDGKLGQMDVAIYKFMDDVAAFKFKEVPEDLKRMWKLGTRFEREIKVREGDEPGAKTVAAAPVSKVQARTVQHDPATLERATPPANDEQFWAKRVAGSDINPTQMQRSAPTLH